MKITVFGCGYLGATHAACMAELGHDVLGVEADPDKLAALRAKSLPFFEPGLSEILERNIDAGRLRFTDDPAEAAAHATTHFIAVGTPQKKGDFAADLRYVYAVIDDLAKHLNGHHVLIGKSTVPVGTAAELAVRARRANDTATVEIAWNPEFLREGHAVEDTLRPDRIVVGTESGRGESGATGSGAAIEPGGLALAAVRELYAPVLAAGTPFIVTDLATAEMVKVAANSFLATKISFINAISEVCEASGADVSTLADAIGYDARIGRKFLNAGLGFGGGCLPKDIRAFMARAGELGADQALTFLREVDSINMRRRTAMVDLTVTVCGGNVLGHNIAVLGTAFKPDSDDVRDSPALNVAGQLQLRGATVTVYDPKAMDNSRQAFPTLAYAPSVLAACAAADAVLVLTEWAEFVELDPEAVAAVVRNKVVLDGRRCLPRAVWQSCGWRYRALGGGS